jgi:hypothetical protein
MITTSFVDEFVKIAEDAQDKLNNYKKVRMNGGHVLLRRGIPVVGNLPKDPDKAIAKIRQVATSERAKRKVLGYKNVAVREKAMPDLESVGFVPTRVATPLPGEGIFQTSWRRGTTHAHKQGPLYLIHEDKYAPAGFGGISRGQAVRHFLSEGIPSLVHRMKERRPLVVVEKAKS